MNSAKRTLALGQVCVRQFSSEAPASSYFHALKGKQARFQVADGLPVFLKGGIMDKLMYQSTMALCVVGLGMMSKLFWDLAVPKK